jgi:hypothetical protein
MMITNDWLAWRRRTMAQAHIVNFPDNIEEICKKLERGVETWKIALENDETTAMIGHYYRAYRGKHLSEARARVRGKQRKVEIETAD